MPKKPKMWKRKASVAQRYDCNTRSVDRMVEDGRITKPHYFGDSPIPFWSEEEMDEHDLRVIKGRSAAA
jgi:hypothetical protein